MRRIEGGPEKLLDTIFLGGCHPENFLKLLIIHNTDELDLELQSTHQGVTFKDLTDTFFKGAGVPSGCRSDYDMITSSFLPEVKNLIPKESGPGFRIGWFTWAAAGSPTYSPFQRFFSVCYRYCCFTRLYS